MYKVDVLVAGGGVAGALTAAKLANYGFKCLMVEARELAAEQSGHSHGYIHRGYIYLRAERALVDKLKSARELWEEYLFFPTPVISHNPLSLVGFENSNVAEFAVDTRGNAGLPIVRLKKSIWPSYINQLSTVQK